MDRRNATLESYKAYLTSLPKEILQIETIALQDQIEWATSQIGGQARAMEPLWKEKLEAAAYELAERELLQDEN